MNSLKPCWFLLRFPSFGGICPENDQEGTQYPHVWKVQKQKKQEQKKEAQGERERERREREGRSRSNCHTTRKARLSRTGEVRLEFHGMNIYELSTRNLTGAMNCNQNAQQMYSWQSALAVFMPAMKARLAAISTEQPVAPVSLGASMAS